jgi:hypothetical protein
VGARFGRCLVRCGHCRWTAIHGRQAAFSLAIHTSRMESVPVRLFLHGHDPDATGYFALCSGSIAPRQCLHGSDRSLWPGQHGSLGSTLYPVKVPVSLRSSIFLWSLFTPPNSLMSNMNAVSFQLSAASCLTRFLSSFTKSHSSFCIGTITLPFCCTRGSLTRRHLRPVCSLAP